MHKMMNEAIIYIMYIKKPGSGARLGIYWNISAVLLLNPTDIFNQDRLEAGRTNISQALLYHIG